ncbi:MAG TPA: MBOAT family O-acyltransferase, partial [Candidatus Ozemobacteraceae bacterium]|nr:MBOAT family O-acyltransferase [Candidatus Ozemobacteraceae bacterium]
WKSFEFSEAYYLKQMRELYGRLRAAVPDCDVLILGPYERLKPEDGVFINYAEHDRVRALQRQVAREFGFAYFDSWSFWGGKGQMRRLIKEKLAHTDYAHLTMEGGDRMADGITAEIMGAYGRRVGDKKLAERATSGKLTHGQVTEEDAGGPIMFNSNAYLIFYLIVFAMAAILLRFGLARIVFLTVVSWYFYATWQWWALGLMLFSTFIDYFSAIRIGTLRDRLGLAGRTEAGVPGWNRGLGWLLLSLVSNLGLLFSFKYHDFIATLFNPLLAEGALPQIPLLDLILPVGISFYTFQTLSYTIDVYRGMIAPEKSFWRFSLFVSFFPQLVAGPIVRATQFLPGLRDRFRHFTPDARICGIAFWLLGTGLVKKCLADWIAMSHVDRVFQMPSMYTASEALLAIYGFGAQIYLDFSSYTGMAIGSAMLLGFNLTENFKEPYKSISISDFWRRWHISLGTWIRDYIYISLGGNRKRVYLNLFITMFLAGL